MSETTFKVGDVVRHKAEESGMRTPIMTIHTIRNKSSDPTKGIETGTYAYCKWFNALTWKFEYDTFHFDELISSK